MKIKYRGLEIEVLYDVILRYNRVGNPISCKHNWKELLEGKLGFDSPRYLIRQTEILDISFQCLKNIKKALYTLDDRRSNWIWAFGFSHYWTTVRTPVSP